MKGSSSSSDLRDFDIVGTIGEGSFAKVYRVVRKSDGQTYAMKRCKMGQMKPKDRENALNEVRILASITNPFVIAYKQAIYEESTEYLYIIMEYAAGGDLMQQVKSAGNSGSHQQLDEKQIWTWIYQMLLGLKSLHDLKILHRDFKCANVFLDRAKRVKIGDLNVSKCTQANLARTQVGTPYYTSPEVWNHEMYNQKSDIWSLGCLLYELCALKPPFTAPDMHTLFQKVSKGTYDRIPSRYSQELSQFIGCCLTVKNSDRLDCDGLLALSSMRRKIEELRLDDIVADAYTASGYQQPNQLIQQFSQPVQTMGKRSTSAAAVGITPHHQASKSLLDRINFPTTRGANLQDRLPKPSYNTTQNTNTTATTNNNNSSTPTTSSTNQNHNNPNQANCPPKEVAPAIQLNKYQLFPVSSVESEEQRNLRKFRSNSGISLKSPAQNNYYVHVQVQQQQSNNQNAPSQQRSFLRSQNHNHNLSTNGSSSSNPRGGGGVEVILEQEIQRRMSCLNLQENSTNNSNLLISLQQQQQQLPQQPSQYLLQRKKSEESSHFSSAVAAAAASRKPLLLHEQPQQQQQQQQQSSSIQQLERMKSEKIMFIEQRRQAVASRIDQENHASFNNRVSSFNGGRPEFLGYVDIDTRRLRTAHNLSIPLPSSQSTSASAVTQIKHTFLPTRALQQSANVSSNTSNYSRHDSTGSNRCYVPQQPHKKLFDEQFRSHIPQSRLYR